MADIRDGRVDSFGRSSKVIPISDETLTESKGDGQIINVPETSPEMQDHTIGGMSVDGGAGEYNPHDAWLPITESRNGSTLTAAFHLFCSGIGIQVLSLPIAFVALGWFWAILCLSLLFSWQLYTIWLLVNLHESAPVTGIRYSRFLHLSIVAFGEKIGKLVAMFPTMYLSGGTCVLYIITGGTTMELFYQSLCNDDLVCKAKTLTGAEWFLLFICIAIFIAHFFPNLNSLALVAFIGSMTALAYCTLLWILPLTKGRPDVQVKTPVASTSDAFRIRNYWSWDHRSHVQRTQSCAGDTGECDLMKNSAWFWKFPLLTKNLVFGLMKGTLPTKQKQPSRKSMWRGVTIAYLLIAICMYPLAIVGYWVYEEKIPVNGGILNALTKYHQNSTSKYIIRAIYLTIISNYLCAFQIYAMPTFDNFSRLYIATKNKPCPRWVQSAIKVLFGGLTYFISITYPFLPSLGAFIGAIALPLTLVYPCFMWIAIKKPLRFSTMWCLNLGLGSSGAMLSVILIAAALWSLIVDGLEANFFKPK